MKFIIGFSIAVFGIALFFMGLFTFSLPMILGGMMTLWFGYGIMEDE